MGTFLKIWATYSILAIVVGLLMDFVIHTNAKGYLLAYSIFIPAPFFALYIIWFIKL
jgi:hypothetical protein